MIAAALLAVLAGESLELRATARVEGRYVRLSEVVAGVLPAALADVYLGRAPARGRARIVSADDVRRELAWRGHKDVAVRGEAVRVENGDGAVLEDEVRVSRPPAAVKAREIVRAAGAAFDVDARALQDGAEGQVIRLEHLATGAKFKGRVAGAGRVEVIE